MKARSVCLANALIWAAAMASFSPLQASPWGALVLDPGASKAERLAVKDARGLLDSVPGGRGAVLRQESRDTRKDI